MTWMLYKGDWYEVDRDDCSTMAEMIEEMLDWGDLDHMLAAAAEDEYGTLAGLAEALLHDGADSVLDALVGRTMASCMDAFDEAVMPLVEETREEEPL